MSTQSAEVNLLSGHSAPDLVGAVSVESVKPSATTGELDTNDNNSSKHLRLDISPVGSGGENMLSVLGSPGVVTTMMSSVTLTPVSSPAIMSFPAGINLTINNGAVPALSTTVSSTPFTTITPALVSNTQVTHSHTQLKVPTPAPIQLRPQVYSLQNNSIAMAMQNRLSLPFQTSAQNLALSGQNMGVPTSISNLRTIQPGTIPVTTVFSPHVQFQTVAAVRGGTPVSIATTSQQQGQPQQMSIRPTAFPLLLNRNVAFAGRPQLISTQPTRLAPRPLGTQMALQVSGQQQMTAATIMPMFRPNQATKGITGSNVSGIPVSMSPSQAQQAQFVNQVMAAASVAGHAGMTHISFRSNTVGAKVLERPSKVPEARLISAMAPNRMVRPTGITITTLPNSVMLVDPSSSLAHPQDVAKTTANTLIKTASTTLMPDTTKSLAASPGSRLLVGEPQVRMPGSSQYTSSAAKGDSASSAVALSQAAQPRSQAESQVNSAADAKKDGQNVAEGKKPEDMIMKESRNVEGEIDAMKFMDWSDGIGSLPGSNLKFKVNEFGLMEVVTEEISEPTMVDSAVGVNTTDFGMTGNHGAQVADSPSTLVKRENDPIQRCENCGKFGYLSEFCKSGRFCSQTCVGAYAGKKNLNRKHSLLSPKILMNLKKKKKKHRLGEFEDGRPRLLSAADPNSRNTPEDEKPVLQNQSRKARRFDWQTYLEEEKAVAAPARLFKDPFPTQRNGFKVGMRLEGIDPKHQSLFCVMSVAETQGYRLRLHFDGFSECYDFWANADSPFIFPVGWCEKNNKPLQPPKHVPPENFNWSDYLHSTKSVAAPKNLFVGQPAATVTPSAFRVGMKLEAVDRKNTVLTCVATVADTLGDKVLVHFDGWEDVYDYWCDVSSPYIHPVGWCQENAHTLSPPCDWKDVATFTWEDYLTQTKTQAVPARAFKPRPPVGFEPGMKVEAVDRRNPILVRVATIQEVREQEVLVHFDGWLEMYDYWLDDDSPDIKPTNWCSNTGHALQPPFVDEELVAGSCPTPGCNGVGHIKGAKYVGHHSAFGCPYSTLNMNKESTLQDRLGSTRIEEGPVAPLFIRTKMEAGEIRKCPTPGCDSSGHITGKFTSHHRLSGCPLYEKNILRMKAELAGRSPGRPGRGRKRKSFDFDVRRLREQNGHHGHHGESRRVDPSSVLHEGIHQSVFMSTVSPTPSQEQPPFWEQHAKLLPGVDHLGGNEVKKWSIDQVAGFVATLPGCREQEKVFREQQIDGEAFLLLNQADIVKIMNIKLGPALKIFNSIIMFKQSCDT